MEEGAYLDSQAAVPVDPAVLEAMMPFFKKHYGNPSSLHTPGRDAKAAIEEARAKVATFINANPRELLFTSCATESLNLAIDGILANKTGGKVITSVMEHPAVLAPLQKYAKKGIEILEIPTDKEGLVDPYSIIDYLNHIVVMNS